MKYIILLVFTFLSCQIQAQELKTPDGKITGNVTKKVRKHSVGATCVSAKTYVFGKAKFAYIDGTVKSEFDELSAAMVTLINDSTGQSEKVYTNDFGEFGTRVMPGLYYLRIEHPAYKNIICKKLFLKGGEKMMLHYLITKKDDPNVVKKK